jgi:hypothetical protein
MIRQQLGFAMRESIEAPNEQGQFETIVEPASNSRSHSRHHAGRISAVDPPLHKSEETSDCQDLGRRSRKTNQGRSENVIRDLKIDHKTTLQAQRLRYQNLKHDFGIIQKENGRLTKELHDRANDNIIQKQCVDRYNYIVGQFLLPYAQNRHLHFDDRTPDTLNFILSPLVQDAQEAETLRGRIQVLQKELLARENMTAAISDEKFANDFCKLAAQIKTLSRLLRPYENLDIVEALGFCFMASGVAPHHWESRVGRKLFVEAWTWSILLQMVFQNPFTIFGVESGMVANLWSSMFGSEHCHGWPTPSPPCETWRYKTMEQLVAVVDEDIITQGKTKENYLYLEQQVADARASVISTIETGLRTITPQVDSSQVLQIVNGAFSLLMHMSVQLPRLQIKFPRSGDSFDKTEMKTQATLDEEDDTDHGIVAASVIPGLIKWGDVKGKNHDHHYAIVPALVLLQASKEANS